MFKKTFRKFVVGALTLSSAAALSGCDERTQREMMISFVREFGVQISIGAFEGDYCLEQQLRRWLREYRALSDAEKNGFKQALKSRYQRVELRATTVAQTITGDWTTLRIVERHCRLGGCYDSAEADKLILDNRRVEGETPATHGFLALPGHLVIRTQMTRDLAVHRVYDTTSVSIYDELEYSDVEAFSEARARGTIRLSAEWARERQRCGTWMPLEDLLAEMPDASYPELDQDQDQDQDDHQEEEPSDQRQSQT